MIEKIQVLDVLAMVFCNNSNCYRILNIYVPNGMGCEGYCFQRLTREIEIVSHNLKFYMSDLFSLEELEPLRLEVCVGSKNSRNS